MFRPLHVAACLALLLSSDAAQDKPTGQRFASNEIVVKFSGTSKGAELAANALVEGNPSDAALGGYVKAISSELGVPLEVKRFGSGGNVILAVRTSELVDDLAKRFRTIPDVEDARIVSEKIASTSSIELDFRENSRETEVLARAAGKGPESSAGVDAITGRLEQDYRVPLTARVVSSRRLLVTPDLQKLTMDLVMRMKKRADIEYAQPNFVLHPTNTHSDINPRP